MKFFFFLFILLLTISCASNKGVYWCGDHPCINKKEKEAYFKKNMVVEMKSAKKTDYKNNSEIDQLMQEAEEEAEEKEKIRIKNNKSSSKQVRLEEKKLAKQIELEEKRQIKEEKKLAKQIKLEEKKQNKKKKKSSIKKIDGNNENQLKKTEINLSEFSEIVEKITRKNAIKAYPDINDIAN